MEREAAPVRCRACGRHGVRRCLYGRGGAPVSDRGVTRSTSRGVGGRLQVRFATAVGSLVHTHCRVRTAAARPWWLGGSVLADRAGYSRGSPDHLRQPRPIRRAPRSARRLAADHHHRHNLCDLGHSLRGEPRDLGRRPRPDHRGPWHGLLRDRHRTVLLHLPRLRRRLAAPRQRPERTTETGGGPRGGAGGGAHADTTEFVHRKGDVPPRPHRLDEDRGRRHLAPVGRGRRR